MAKTNTRKQQSRKVILGGRHESIEGSVSEALRGIEVVYYIKLDEQVIKIGTSSSLLTRMHKYGLNRESAKHHILAIEFGGRDLERQRHQEFAHLRLGQAEHFHFDDALLDHIERLRLRYNVTT